MIKATAGGGGLGMRLAKEHDEFMKLLQQAQSEAAAAFGIDGVYLEKYIQNAHENYGVHIRVLLLDISSTILIGSHSCFQLFVAILTSKTVRIFQLASSAGVSIIGLCADGNLQDSHSTTLEPY
ncbi:hypothetical protein L1887_32599 [Cichorium endivia]|nr:hypothetical protein L1887_32599 [Cichorium endivia]